MQHILEKQYVYIVSRQERHLSCLAHEEDAAKETNSLNDQTGTYNHYYEPYSFYIERNKHVDSVYVVFCDRGDHCYSVSCWTEENQAKREVDLLNALNHENSIYKYELLKIN